MNLHLMHAEDSVIYGLDSIQNTLDLLQDIQESFLGIHKNNLTLQYKVDGSPNLVFGIHPLNGKFFVGTKSVFAKNPKINYSNEDIHRNHPDTNLQDILKIALKYLPESVKGGIWSGDVMFTFLTLEEKIIRGILRENTFKPNVIRYVPQNNSILDNETKLGLFIHTKYIGDDFHTMKAVYHVFEKYYDFIYSSNVWIGRANFFNYYHKDTKYSSQNFNEWMIYCTLLLNHYKEEPLTPEIQKYLQLFLNHRIKNNLPFLEDNIVFQFFYFIAYLLQKEKEQLKTKEAIKKRRLKKIELEDHIYKYEYGDKSRTFTNYFKLINAINNLKMILLQKVPNTIGPFSLYFDNPDGSCTQTKPEGLVAQNKTSGFSIKLVDRFCFSQRNFAVHNA